MDERDDALFGTMIKIENKDLFVDLRRNSNGVYLKLSERKGTVRNTVLIPASGILRLKNVLEEALQISMKNVKISAERKQRIAENPEVTTRSVYVQGLAWSTTNEGLAAYFSTAGNIVNANVLYRTRGGRTRSLGCAVVEYQTADEALNALEVLNNTELDGRMITCREDRVVPTDGETARYNEEDDHVEDEDDRAVAAATARVSFKLKNNAPPSSFSDPNSGGGTGAGGNRVLEPNKVFVTSLPWKVTAEDLVIIFGSVGPVVSANVLSTNKGRSLGHAIIEYTQPQVAIEAIKRINGRELDGRTLIVKEYYL